MGDRLLLVCSGGGHLTEAMHLVENLENIDEIHWATPDTGQSQALLAGESAWPITNVGPRELAKTLALFPRARKLIAQLKPTVVISTGASPAIPFLVVAATKGIPAHFVESLTRIDRPSLTGRLLVPIPKIHCYSQYDNFGGRWRKIGSQFDSYQAQSGVDHVPIRRVVVTVGTLRDYPFRSLVERLPHKVAAVERAVLLDYDLAPESLPWDALDVGSWRSDAQTAVVARQHQQPLVGDSGANEASARANERRCQLREHALQQVGVAAGRTCQWRCWPASEAHRPNLRR